MRPLFLFIAVACLTLAGAHDAAAESFGFNLVTSNSTYDVSSQLSVDISEDSDGDILFLLSNTGALASTIAVVYWDDDGKVLFQTEANDTPEFTSSSSGVDFDESVDKASGAQPGGMSWTAEFAIGASSAPAAEGVDPGEYAGFTLRLQSGKDFDDVLAALGDGSLLLGLHVISLPDGQSDWYEAPSAVPEPGSAALMGLALLVGFGLHRRRRKTHCV